MGVLFTLLFADGDPEALTGEHMSPKVTEQNWWGWVQAGVWPESLALTYPAAACLAPGLLGQPPDSCP